MKVRRRVVFFSTLFIGLGILAALEACHWSTGPIRSIHTSSLGHRIATVTHGFTDRRTYVFDEQKGLRRKPIYSFRANEGPYTMAWDSSGRYYQFRRGNEMFIFDVKLHAPIAKPPAAVTFTPFLSASHEPDGKYLWFGQSVRYETD